LGTHGVHGRYWIQGSGFLCGTTKPGDKSESNRVKGVGVSDHGIIGLSTSDSEARTRKKTDQAEEEADDGDPSIEE